ncbi:hypothetical protein AQ946_05625 [Burkholderia pseudomallei]|nr:hypothetical protein AQ766_27320 [Burkholderia pseudomallei]ONE15039.1 hypothetical protein AQ946_05625 [Burkholderia pseudomallei]ONE40757.1 hypothetical protein AQ948_12535 [Burkholderia pseudomallei]ONE41901.1 hypothetical protein AQ947_09990 [Burkholderia pseudomallei]
MVLLPTVAAEMSGVQPFLLVSRQELLPLQLDWAGSWSIKSREHHTRTADELMKTKSKEGFFATLSIDTAIPFWLGCQQQQGA